MLLKIAKKITNNPKGYFIFICGLLISLFTVYNPEIVNSSIVLIILGFAEIHYK